MNLVMPAPRCGRDYVFGLSVHLCVPTQYFTNLLGQFGQIYNVDAFEDSGELIRFEVTRSKVKVTCGQKSTLGVMFSP